MEGQTPNYVRYLWDELPAETRDKYLAQMTRKLARKAAEQGMKSRGRPRYLPFEESDDFWQEFEGVVGLNLDDNWHRLCALHIYETLVFNIRERYEAEWTSVYSKNVKATKAMKEWPNVHKHTLKWKFTCVHEAQVLRIEWYEEHGQYKVEFRFGPGVTQTFWFYPEFKDSRMGQGWVTPRRINKTVPLPVRR